LLYVGIIFNNVFSSDTSNNNMMYAQGVSILDMRSISVLWHKLFSLSKYQGALYIKEEV